MLVTGCAKGETGYEYRKAFAEYSCHVVASDIPKRISKILGLEESVSSAVSTVVSKYGHIDVLTINAGIGSTGPLAELSLYVIRKAWEINTLGQSRFFKMLCLSRTPCHVQYLAC